MALLAANLKQPISTREIAARFQISEAHLSKVLQRLTKAGFVESTRGPKGGFIIGKPIDEITLLDVYESIEGPLVSCDCLLGVPVCGDGGCILGDLLVTVNRQVREYLAGTRLSELADRIKEQKT